MLDKYIGDAIMAVYGAPLPLTDHPIRACQTALAMIAALEPLNRAWSERGLPSIAIGVGINTGTVSVGNMGSEARFDYTVMGDAVNLGARLEGLTKTYGVSILVGEATERAARDHFVFREVDSVRVIGRKAATRVFELCGSAASSKFSLQDTTDFAEALQLYRARNWDAAESAVRGFLQRYPEDGPCAVLLERIAELRSADLPEDWDGVFAQMQK
jgi:adenylate cyclase